MPTLNIEGRKVKVDDSFLKLSPADQQSTVEEIASQLGIKTAQQAAPVSGMFDQFASGLDQPLEDIGVTMELTGMKDSGKAVRDFTSKPENFVSASSRVANPAPGDSYVDPLFGIGWGNVPGAIAEQAGGYAGLMASRAAGGAVGGMVTKNPYGAVAGAIAGPALFSFARQLGPSVLEIAKNDNRGPDELTWQDWSQAAATAGVSGALDAIGIGKIGFLNNTVKEVGKKTATEVVKNTVKETGKKAIQEGVTEAGQSVVEQFGTSVGTETGAKVDLKEAFAEGIIGAGTGGTIDAVRNAYPTVSTALDVRSVDSAMRNNPDAQAQAEIIQKANNIADRMKGSGKAPLSKEINESVKHLKDQVVEVLNNQNLSNEDKTALQKALNTANGMDEADVDAIAGRSENPSEIKALVRKIQVIREMTMQQQSAKGLRGAIADTAYNMGSPLGAFIGDTMFPGGGAAAGAFIGDRIGTGISRRLKANQTQGVAIDSLVGAKQARRARMLLDRYGPSEATTALNTLTEKAAANKMQAEADAQAKKDAAENFKRTQEADKARKEARRAEEAAVGREEKAKARAKRDAVDLETRDTRLKNLAIQAQQRRVRLEMMSSKLEAEKSLNSLRVEMAQTQRDLTQLQATSKAAVSKAQADGRILDLKSKLIGLAKDIELRDLAVRKATASVVRAEKMAERVPAAKTAADAAASQTAKRYAKMTSDQMSNVQVDQFGNPIKNREQFRMAAEYIMKLEADGLLEAAKFEDKALGNVFIEAVRDFHANPGHKNQARRMAIYQRIMAVVPAENLDAHRFIAMYLRPLAMAFEAKSGGQEGREDFGSVDEQDLPF